MLSRSKVIKSHSPGFSRILDDVNLYKEIDLQYLKSKKKNIQLTNNISRLLLKKRPLLTVATVLQNWDLATTVKTRLIFMKYNNTPKINKFSNFCKLLRF